MINQCAPTVFSTKSGTDVCAASGIACGACAAGKYRGAQDGSSCMPCPAQSSSPAGSTSSAACTCNAGYVVVPASGRCKLQVQTLPVVEVTVSLPMSKADFERQEDLFVAALAKSAGVEVSDVSIISVTESSAARRRLLAPSVQVSSEIQASDTDSVSQALTTDTLNKNLGEAGLPQATGPITTSVREPPAAAPALEEPPVKEKTKSQLPLIIGGSVAGGVLLVAGAWLIYKKFQGTNVKRNQPSPLPMSISQNPIDSQICFDTGATSDKAHHVGQAWENETPPPLPERERERLYPEEAPP